MILINESALFGSTFLFLSDICTNLCRQLSLHRSPLLKNKKSVLIKPGTLVQELAFMFQQSETKWNRISHHSQVRSNQSLFFGCFFLDIMFYVDLNALGTLASSNIIFIFSPKRLIVRIINFILLQDSEFHLGDKIRGL